MVWGYNRSSVPLRGIVCLHRDSIYKPLRHLAKASFGFSSSRTSQYVSKLFLWDMYLSSNRK